MLKLSNTLVPQTSTNYHAFQASTGWVIALYSDIPIILQPCSENRLVTYTLGSRVGVKGNGLGLGLGLEKYTRGI